MVVIPRFLRIFVLVAFSLLTVSYLWSIRRRNNEHPRDKWYQLNPFEWQTQVESYDFKTLPAERACADGSIERHNSPGLPARIPCIVHFVWILSPDGNLTFAFYLAIQAALMRIKPDMLKVHYTNINRDNYWLKKLGDKIILERHDPAVFLDAAGFGANGHWKTWDVAHVADVLRLQILQAEGGIYLDADVYALRSFDTLLQGARDVVMGHEGGNRFGASDAVILAKRQAPFINRWVEAYVEFDAQSWNYHSVVLPKLMANEHPNEICILSPTAFFWPTWTSSHIEYMHKLLSKQEADEVKARIAAFDGALYDDQLAHHATSHGSYEKYIKRLTPAIMREEDTRFNILLRPFLPEE